MKHINWRSWLPAIGFAVALHAILIGVFMTSRHGSKVGGDNTGTNATPSISSTSDPLNRTNPPTDTIATEQTLPSDDDEHSALKKLEIVQANIVPENLVPAHIAKNSVTTADDVSSQINNPSQSRVQTKVQTANKRRVSQDTQPPTIANQSQNSEHSNPKDPVVDDILVNDTPMSEPNPKHNKDSNVAINATINTDASNIETQLPATAPSQRPANTGNLLTNNDISHPADKFLTKRDLPQAQASQKTINEDAQQQRDKRSETPLTEIEQTEAINNELSNLIDSVRARNARQIKQNERDQQSDSATSLPQTGKQNEVQHSDVSPATSDTFDNDNANDSNSNAVTVVPSKPSNIAEAGD